MSKDFSAEYTTIRLPKKLLRQVDQVVKCEELGFKSRAEFIKEWIRKGLEEAKKLQPPMPLPTLEHFNLNETGVRILDRSLASTTTSGRIIDVFFHSDAVYCENCQSDQCQHVKFALELDTVKEILNKKGWKLKP